MRKDLMIGWVGVGLLLCLPFSVLAQSLIGKVVDAESEEGVPFANIYYEGSQIGGMTDADGNFSIPFRPAYTYLLISYVGYEKGKVAVPRTNTPLKITLIPESGQMEELVITRKGYENPAWDIIRHYIDYREQNDYDRLEAYDYQTYTRNEFLLTELNEKLEKRKVFREVMEAGREKEVLSGANSGLPVFISETSSRNYFAKTPKRRTERVYESRIAGIGVDDGSLLSQFTGAGFQDYNFYGNYVSVMQKQFISPLGKSWKMYYDYELDLQKMHVVDGIPCYKIRFWPKRAQDLAFSGVVYIADEDHRYAMKKIEAGIGKGANINFVDSVYFEQELVEVEADQPLMPKKQLMLLRVSGGNKLGKLLYKNYIENKGFVLNVPQEPSFYEQEVVVLSEEEKQSSEEVATNALDALDVAGVDPQHLALIDSVSQMKSVKRTMALATILGTGYINAGGLDVGTYGEVIAYNDIEGVRLQVGGLTNVDLSKKFLLEGYVAYGTRDQKIKYSLMGNWFINRDKWHLIGGMHARDIGQVGLTDDERPLPFLFRAANRWGTLIAPFEYNLYKVWWQSDITKGLTSRVVLRHRQLSPVFDFGYYDNAEEGQDPVLKGQEGFDHTEVSAALTYAPGVRYVQTAYNTRMAISSDSRPVIFLKYTYGIPQLSVSALSYHKVEGSLQQLKRSRFGQTTYRWTAGFIPTPLPFPLLENHLGNTIPILYNADAFNQMNSLEFVSDRYVSLRLLHQFEGLLFNRIPLMNRLRWRAFGGANLLYGSLSEENQAMMYGEQAEGSLRTLEELPYAEAYYGIENILKVFKVYFVHRLTYTDTTAPLFSIRMSAGFSL
ncbi:DUF5686 and carboxypeptidase-like regulatory domain-containing protein [Algivirga pacifica]|uniref:DUF5686 family protein n=1 Tax=Algivirga pacifica TaxID=1162670 RepID=A0ABP9D4V6_9BACT